MLKTALEVRDCEAACSRVCMLGVVVEKDTLCLPSYWAPIAVVFRSSLSCRVYFLLGSALCIRSGRANASPATATSFTQLVYPWGS